MIRKSLYAFSFPVNGTSMPEKTFKQETSTFQLFLRMLLKFDII